MPKPLTWTLITVGLLAVVFAGYVVYGIVVANPRVVEELESDPDGERARRVMLLTFADGKAIPVNYLREGQTVFVGADGPWWRAFRGAGQPVSMLIRGETLAGHAQVVLDDPAYTHDVFARLRPAAPEWLPDWLNGKLVVIELEGDRR